MMDTIEDPDEIRARVDQVTAAWKTFYDRFYDLVKDEDLSQALAESIEEGKVVYAMFAASDSGLQNFNLGYEKLNAVQTLAVTEEAYISAAEPQLQTALESMGVTDYAADRVTVTLGGREMPGLRISGTYNGVKLYELSAACKGDGYIASFSFSSFGVWMRRSGCGSLWRNT